MSKQIPAKDIEQAAYWAMYPRENPNNRRMTASEAANAMFTEAALRNSLGAIGSGLLGRLGFGGDGNMEYTHTDKTGMADMLADAVRRRVIGNDGSYYSDGLGGGGWY